MYLMTDPYYSHHNPSFKSTSTKMHSHVARATTFNNSNSSCVHHSSLIDPSMHSPDLLKLVDARLSAHFVDHIVDCVADALDFAMGRPLLPLDRRPFRHAALVGFRVFVKNLLVRAEVTTPTILASLAYIDRAKTRLHLAFPEEWALERILLAALVVASKYFNDYTLNNHQWQDYNYIFGAREISGFELEFLHSLHWNMRLSDNDILVHYDDIYAVDEPFPNHLQYFRCSLPRQRQSQSSQADTRNRCPELESSSSISTGDTSLPHTPPSSKKSFTSHDSAPSKKPKSSFRRWLQSFRTRSRQIEAGISVAQ